MRIHLRRNQTLNRRTRGKAFRVRMPTKRRHSEFKLSSPISTPCASPERPQNRIMECNERALEADTEETLLEFGNDQFEAINAEYDHECQLQEQADVRDKHLNNMKQEDSWWEERNESICRSFLIGYAGITSDVRCECVTETIEVLVVCTYSKSL
jgi:hypothetical protein